MLTKGYQFGGMNSGPFGSPLLKKISILFSMRVNQQKASVWIFAFDVLNRHYVGTTAGKR